MTGRVLFWAGATAGVLLLAGLGVYFAEVGLDKADKLGSVVGALIATASLGLSVFGLIRDERNVGSASKAHASAPDGRSITIAGDNTGVASTGDNTRNTQSR